MSGNTTVQSVDRVVDLLEILTDLGGAAPLRDLAAESKLPLPTIHRLMRTLVARGYARQLPSRQYTLGPRLIRLGESAGRQLGAGTRPHLQRVADTLGETSNLAMIDRDMAVYVAQASSSRSMRMFTEVGRRVFCHATGVGKAVLAQLPEETVRQIVDRVGMPPATEHSIDNIADLLVELEKIREQGYAVDDGEQEEGVRCYAVAVPEAPVPTAVSVSGPSTRVTYEFADRAIPLLHDVAGEIAAELLSAG